MERQTEGETERQRETERDRETETAKQTDRDRDRQTDIQRQTDRKSFIHSFVRSLFCVCLLKTCCYVLSLLKVTEKSSKKTEHFEDNGYVLVLFF